MIPLLDACRAEIAALCRRFHVRRLEVFGSAARGTDFDPARSDVDLLVTYDRDVKRPSLGEHFELHDLLEAVLGRRVDLVIAGAVEKPLCSGRDRALTGAVLCSMIRGRICGTCDGLRTLWRIFWPATTFRPI